MAMLLSKIFKVFTRIGTIQPILIALLCWVIVIIGSWIHDFHRPPNFYLSNKRNVFNVVFAKWALAWTLAFLTPYMVLIYWVKSRYNLKVVCKNVLRLVVAYVIWYVVTYILNWIEHLTGDCEGTDFYEGKEECRREGLIWNGVDISGHSFLLSYCTLIISEEIQVVNFWTNEIICSDNESNHANESISSNETMALNERESRPNERFLLDMKKQPVVVRYLCIILYVICCLLMSMWLILLAFTSMYFHTVNSKVLGIILGLSAWYYTYQVNWWSKYFPGYATRY